jgi:hypothetical protein
MKNLSFEIFRNWNTGVDFFHFNSFVDELYRKYAPCAFMPLFKLDFMNTMEGYVEMASSGQRTPSCDRYGLLSAQTLKFN